jgi:hypothetical protein
MCMRVLWGESAVLLVSADPQVVLGRRLRRSRTVKDTTRGISSLSDVALAAISQLHFLGIALRGMIRNVKFRGESQVNTEGCA